MSKKTPTTSVVAKINQTDLIVIENGSKLVPIKPICEILGVDVESQRKKILEDPILSSTAVLSTVVAADGKARIMTCIPFKFTFGWIFTINPDRVSPEARESVIHYKLACYDALYKHFAEHAEFVEYRQMLVEERLEVVEKINEEFSSAKTKLKEAKDALNEARRLTWQEYVARKAQMEIDWPEQSPEEGGAE